jgi:hypothetical protein
MRYAMIAFVAVLLCGAGFFAWSGVVVGARAFEAHPDSKPYVYLVAGGVYGAFALALTIRAVYILTRQRPQR